MPGRLPSRCPVCTSMVALTTRRSSNDREIKNRGPRRRPTVTLGLAVARAQGVPACAALLEMCLLMTLFSVARLDIKPSARALILNPWFVFTQAPFAGHRAKALIAKCRTESEGFNFRGVLGLIDLCESRLLAPQGPQSRGAPGARLPARATTASRRRPVAPAGARIRRRDRQLLKSCPRAPRGFPQSRRLTVCFLASNLEARPTALGRPATARSTNSPPYS
jgi:hypothetical protein